jgi:hypothetical protein
MLLRNKYILYCLILRLGNIQSDHMTTHKSTVKLNISKERGSGTIYLKKELVEKIVPPGENKTSGIIPNVDLLALYDDEKDELTIREPK